MKSGPVWPLVSSYCIVLLPQEIAVSQIWETVSMRKGLMYNSRAVSLSQSDSLSGYL